MEKLDLLKMVNDRLKEEREKLKTQSITSENDTSLKGDWEDIEPLGNQTLSKDSLSSENDTSLKGDWEDVETSSTLPVEEPPKTKEERPSTETSNVSGFMGSNAQSSDEIVGQPGVKKDSVKFTENRTEEEINKSNEDIKQLTSTILEASGYKPDDKIGGIPAKFIAEQVAKRNINSGSGSTGVGTASQALMFGFGDEISAGISSLFGQGNYKDNVARLRAIENMSRAANPNEALIGDIVGSIAGPSVGLAGLKAAGKGLKVGEGLLKSTAKVAAAGAGDAALMAAGTSDGENLTSDITAGAGLGALGGAFVRGVAAPVASAIVTKLPESIIKRFKDKEQVVGDFVFDKISKLTNKDELTVKAAFESAKDAQEAFTILGLDQKDSVKLIKQLSNLTSGDGKLFGEIQTAAKGKAETNESTIREGVKDYTDEKTNKAIDDTFGKEVGRQFKALTGSDLEGAISELIKLPSKAKIIPKLKEAILERIALNDNIIANTGRTVNEVKPENLIFTDSGKVLMPKKDAVKLTGNALKKIPNEFGYKKEDLVDLLDDNSLTGVTLQSLLKKIEKEISMSREDVSDTPLAEDIITNLSSPSKQIVKATSSDLEKALNAQNTKLSETGMFKETQNFINKKDLTDTDISEFTANMNILSNQSSKSADRRKSITMAMKDFYSIEQKGSGIVDNFGRVNPKFEKALTDNGIDKKDFDDISQIIRESNFLREFDKSTGVVSPEESLLTKNITGFATRLFFMEPVNALKNTILGNVGREFVEGMQKTRKESYSNFVKQIASLDNSDFEKIKKIASTKKVSLYSATTLYLSKYGNKVMSRYAGDNSEKVEPDKVEEITE